MKRSALAVLAATGLLIAAAPGGATGAGSSEKSCTTINLGGTKIFYKHDMNCKSAKKKARQVYSSGGSNEPKHFDCSLRQQLRRWRRLPNTPRRTSTSAGTPPTRTVERLVPWRVLGLYDP